MGFVARHIKWIMLIGGLLTCTMLLAAAAPHTALQTTFGPDFEGAAVEIVVRNWGALIALVGAMLIYAAFNPPVRGMAAAAAIASKMVFIGLVLTIGRDFAAKAAVPLVVDGVMVILLLAYLAGRGRAAG